MGASVVSAAFAQSLASSGDSPRPSAASGRRRPRSILRAMPSPSHATRGPVPHPTRFSRKETRAAQQPSAGVRHRGSPAHIPAPSPLTRPAGPAIPVPHQWRVRSHWARSGSPVTGP
ncbi:hypothetical protein GCM10009805_27740 [Leucobacter chromiireducens subsp. solipictus]